MRILYLSRWYPFPPNNGSKLRIHNLLSGLRQEHEVTLLTFAEQREAHAHEKAPLDGDVQVATWSPYNPHRLRAQLGYFHTAPRSVIDTYSAEMACKLDRLLTSTRFDLVIATQFDMAIYSPRFRHMPALLEEVELGALYERYVGAKGRWARIRHGLTWLKHRWFLASLLENFQLCTVASSKEKYILSSHVKPSQSVEIVPNSVDVQSYRNMATGRAENTLIFTGAFSFEPNYAAMQWFVNDVLPLVKRGVPDVQLVITGDHAGKALTAVDGVTYAGHVGDIRAWISAATVSLAPLQSGGGTRLKILEAMALQTPVVATSKGAEGLDVVHGQHLLIADSPEDFAAAVLSLLDSPSLRHRLVENAYRLICAQYDTAVVVPSFLNLVRQVASH